MPPQLCASRPSARPSCASPSPPISGWLCSPASDQNGRITPFMRAWRKANAHVRAGRHGEAVYWLMRARFMLDRHQRRRRSWVTELDLGYMLLALTVLTALVGSQLW